MKDFHIKKDQLKYTVNNLMKIFKKKRQGSQFNNKASR